MRPEYVSPPEMYYNQEETRKYSSNSSINRIQQKMTRRAVELLKLPKNKPALLLDVGCGSGLSGVVLDEIPNCVWIGVDISQAMLDFAKESGRKGDLLRNDIGETLPFRSHVFDGVISISTIQWLFNADFKDANPVERINEFFKSLNRCLINGGKVVLQFYLEAGQYQILLSAAQRAGFNGGLLCDYPNSSRQRKFYLVCTAGCLRIGFSRVVMANEGNEQEESEDDEDDDSSGSDGIDDGKKAKQDEIPFEWKRQRRARNESETKREKVKKMKNRSRRKGIVTRIDTKYTGRKRSGKFG